MASRVATGRYPSVPNNNNSDDESSVKSGTDADVKEDFISFPTIPDPEQENSKTLSRIFTKTLRKVTTNASHLVQNYSYSSPKVQHTYSNHDEESNVGSSEVFPKQSHVSVDEPTDNSVDFSSKPEQTRTDITKPDSTIPLSITQSPVLESRVGSPSEDKINDKIRPVNQSNLTEMSQSSSAERKLPLQERDPESLRMLSEDSLINRPQSISVGSASVRNPTIIDEANPPRVTSDNKTLRISTMQIPLQTNSAASSVVNVNSHLNDRNSKVTPEPEEIKTVGSRKAVRGTFASRESILNNGKISDDNSLQRRISSIFNNLPNDIELSDDSASDLETINDSFNSSTQPTPMQLGNRSESQLNASGHPYHDMSLYSESIAKSSPIKGKAELHRGYAGPITSTGSSPTLNTFYALKKKDHRRMKEKQSSNLSAVLIDNAKSMFNSNLTGAVVSSASSMVTSGSREKKKKKKPSKPSENPLKSGGIPKKYWMNDSFVSDCLNCFKPFTAFRRKHHCRFCGQIFCSDCTLFISYNQHKEERQNRENKKDNKKKASGSYNDKLRVCKPCYSDVIVYLSDDSSSSDSDDENEQAIDDSDEEQSGSSGSSQVDEPILPQHPLSRIRSLSTNSRRDSRMNEATLAANRGFLNKDSKSILESPTSESNISSVTKLDESIKVHQKQAPQMAIPTTRTGESVEIPVPKSSYNNSTVLGSRPPNFNLDALTMSTSSLNSQHRIHSNVAAETLSLHNNNMGRSWLKNYTHLRQANISTPDLQRSNSMDSISNMYNNIIGKKSSQGRLRIVSSSERDLSRRVSNKSEMIITDSINSDGDYEYDDEFDDGNEKGSESENEDEQAMSLYAALNHSALKTTPLAKNNIPNSTVSVPTLGEFPAMMSNFPRTIAGSTKLFPTATSPNLNHAVTFLEEMPKAENMRSIGRAHASLERIRSRRKSKSVRKLSVRTRDSIRLPSIENQRSLVAPVSPISSPSTPSPNPFSQQSNLSKILVKSTSNGAHFDPDQSPTTPRISDTFEKELSQEFETTDLENGDASLILPDEGIPTIEVFKSRESAFKELLDVVLKQCLEDCDIQENQERWAIALKRTLKSIDHIKVTDTLDIRQYVKIKKVPGGTIEETDVIDGLFMTKNIDSKKMSSTLRNPKIALLMFPLEYLKQKEQFISLRIIGSQQAVYITNLVSRIVSLEPDIIVVGDSVCGLAESLLEEAGITVISNTKPQVIERISRYTKADIFQSVNDLFFKKGTLGTCTKFEIKKYLFQNVVKTFAFFTGNDISAGFTISLRGGDEELLNSVKYAAETLLPGYLNARFENGLLDNSMTTISEEIQSSSLVQYNDILQEMKSDEVEVDLEEENRSCEFSLDSTEVVNYVKLFNERKLSLSPTVCLTLPTPLVNVIDSYYSFHRFFKTNKVIQDTQDPDSIHEEWLDEMKINIDINTLPNRGNDLLQFLKHTSDTHLKALINDYHYRARIWSNCVRFSSYQLYPIFHKKIYVLHSTVSIKHATPCLGPSIVVIDYYTENDKCLGLFLDQIFHESGKDCHECGESLLNHYKTYVHGNAKLDLILERFEDLIPDQQNYRGKNQRVMWSFCKECNYSTPIVSMTDETYYLSLGKFLELAFYGDKIVLNDRQTCQHDYKTSHVRCFGFNDYVIRLEYSKIDNYEVVVPKKQIEFMPEIDIKLKLELFHNIQSKVDKFFQSVSKRLNRVKVDTFDRAEDGLKKIQELKDKLEIQLNALKSKTLKTYNLSAPTNHLCLNIILRELQELGVEWDSEFIEFERAFLPSENEITRLTQFHLRNFLIDKYSETPDTKDLKEKNKKDEKQQELKSEGIIESEKERENYVIPDDIIHPEDNVINMSPEPLNEVKRPDLSTSPLFKISNVRDKINKFEAPVFDTDDAKRIPSTPGRSLSHRGSESSLGATIGIPSQNKVSHLASFFDNMSLAQISKEFQIQREKEMQEKLNKFRAIPIMESKPIVEIYDKIEDVIVNDDDRKKKDPPKEAIDASRSTTENNEDARDPSSLDPSITKAGTKLEIPQPEKISLLKSLTNFWADRSATLWDPLEYPLDSHEHTFADSEVIVRDDEPSSLVAFCLSSNDYKQKIRAMQAETLPIDAVTGFDVENNEDNNKKISSFSKIEKKFKKNFNDRTGKINEYERTMIKNKSNHLKYQFVDGTTNLSCKIFYSEQFEAFRNACGNHDNFIQSLSRCVKWQSSGGKSGSNFLKTLDNRYIVKELSTSELDSFVSIAPFYFKYISQSMFNTLSTAIAKIFGFYQIQVKNTQTGKTFKMDFLIMENLFYNHKTTRIFDLKGSMRNRHVKQTGKENEVLLDENMIEYIYESPVFVQEQSKKLLRGSLFNDTSFLSAMDVMDYSLVIGIDDSAKKLYIGIIDWLRTFTWDKKVENWVKGNNLIGGNRKGKDPTIVTPKQYRIRFREAMERYILEVPDIWYEGGR
ncbi:hypothetical protein G9P44_003872 [Scheffersomyces stipitis]|nr:hypothetical protein G9P44_003872 [Scheffersomyces stipitis]